ncbi:phosphonate metabolism protein/1,5-bisphosphokinase (PRPP-forming) PhnN [Bradyrhizobium septentrionale]|uniref:Ribose 1,5-bisphosphate phosphokinase PhnN n=1 Tax=Bradyrhizobium septentrionale TaxID=1404411 RepID=A0A973VY67_9BRAD|nr:phosphonate metabolism protein/1,5-bisphosphokinase (PRPP-forming) PhnN [Bradyrhizobium septentrionale]UGY12591.1 phosphonate metabolism protein/1,5-bisphosphokinase (PRPP-forming) PhnN [Bradyrhizobium septentrionale]UGY21136.1 phosphonate metabolism protein/1,5-bisphosphokinase (PRPP-forming) PhnN [Bradyrhizobium septentrionale]
MSELPAVAAQHATTIGPGRLILVVGPSGAGKDTLLGLAKAACADDRDIVFARRLITRQASVSEDNEEVSAETFQRAVAAGDYAMYWDAHGHRYALSLVIDDDIRAGRTVIANVSRTVIAAARRNYANAIVVSVTAPPDVLAARLAARGRASDGGLARRLGRTVDESTATPDFTIINSGTAEYHARQLVRIIKGERWDD